MTNEWEGIGQWLGAIGLEHLAKRMVAIESKAGLIELLDDSYVSTDQQVKQIFPWRWC